MKDNISNVVNLSVGELINLTTPKWISKKSEKSGKIIDFSLSNNNMLGLSYINFKKIENEFNDDNDIKNSKYKDIQDVVYDLNNNQTKENYLEIIRKIASVNHTRTPKDVCEEIAEWAVNNKLIENMNAKPNIDLVDQCIKEIGDKCNHYPRSLVSKVFRYLETWKGDTSYFTINDSIIRAVLPYYLTQWGVDYRHDINNSMTYSKYHNYCKELLEKINSKTQDDQKLNLHQLDFLIWYYYSNDSIRLEIIKHIPLNK